MDPYYQGGPSGAGPQQQQQPLQQPMQQQQQMAPPMVGSRGGVSMGGQGELMGGQQQQANPSAPSMPHQRHQPPPPQHQSQQVMSGGRGGYGGPQAPQQQQHQAGYMIDPLQQQQQQQQPLPPMQAQQQPMMQSSGAGGGGGHHSSRSRHYGGGSGSHRSAMMHQHRSSAAAISDPMMASTITDHLASASGPLTGSGGALNQLAGPGYYPQGSSGLAYNPSAQDWTGGGPSAPPASSLHHPSHQSRYDAHYAGPSSRSRSHHHSGSAGGAHHHQQPFGGGGANELGSYGAGLEPSSLDPTGRYYAGQQQHSSSSSHAPHHQSLGNIGAGPSRMYGGAQPLDGGMGLMGPTGDRYDSVGLRAGSMPPGELTAVAGRTSYGLGAYNPLEDPLAGGNQFSHLTTTTSGHSTRAGLPLDPMAGQYGQSALGPANRDAYLTEMRARLQELQAAYAAAKRELETATQKLGSSMHSIKSFWSPELKKERALRKEEQTKYALINDQMKLMRVEVQKQALLIRQLEDELRLAHETARIRTTDPDIQQHIDALCMEKEALFKENCLLRDTIREYEMRLETQKQTLAARDDSIKKMVEMMNNKGLASKIMEEERLEMDRIKTRNTELEVRVRHYETIIESKEKELLKSAASISSSLKATNELPHLNHPTQPAARPNCMSPLPSTSTTSTTNSNFFKLMQRKQDEDQSRQKQAQQVPKSPVPKQRKSLLAATAGGNTQQQQVKQQSKIERLKSRLAASRGLIAEAAAPSATQTNKLMTPHELNELLLKQTSASNSLSSSSSGVSSSRSLELVAAAEQHQASPEQQTKPKEAAQVKQVQQQQQQQVVPLPRGYEANSYEQDYKLCQCHECQSSGQEIYSRDNSAGEQQLAEVKNTMTNQQAVISQQQQQHQRKMVHFRPNVEHIGSPSYRLLNDCRMPFVVNNQDYYYYTSQQLQPPPDGQPQTLVPVRVGPPLLRQQANESCDSLHATKDFSIASNVPSLLGAIGTPAYHDDPDYLRPLDCSTPLNSSGGRCGRRQVVVQAEVHQPSSTSDPNRGNTTTTISQKPSNYTCLCSPDFICAHNYPQGVEHEANGSGAPQQQVGAISELYHQSGSSAGASATKSDYGLSQDCIECKNLSTYVNLSRAGGGGNLSGEQLGQQLSRAHSDESAEPSMIQFDQVANGEANQQREKPIDTTTTTSTTNGYDSGEYKQLIRSKQFDVIYGAAAGGDQPRPAPMQQPRPLNGGELSLDEQLHYLSEARRLSETLNNCSICSEQLMAVTGGVKPRVDLLIDASTPPQPGDPANSNSNTCNCQLGEQHSVDGPETRPAQQTQYANHLSQCPIEQTASSSTLKSSYHTASSSLPLGPAAGPQAANSSAPAGWCTDSLSVLPLPNRQQQQQRFVRAHSEQPTSVPVMSATAVASNARHEQQRQPHHHQLMNQQQQQQQLDSSLSSLFVYRHASDNENGNGPVHHQMPGGFDPDSLEMSQRALSRASSSSLAPAVGGGNQSSAIKELQNQQQRPLKQTASSGWLKPRPKSDYIPLSSATSSLAAHHQQQQSIKKKQDQGKFVQVDSDLSKSSIVKRRQQAQQQQQQSLNGTVKKKLLQSKSSSRSSPNIATASANSSQSHNRSTSSSNGAGASSSTSSSQVKSIYQCVKNHLLDITGGSSSSSTSQQQQQQNSSKTSEISSKYRQSASLPRNLLSTSGKSKQKKTPTPSKAVQMEELRAELARRNQEMLTMGAKMKALEDQQRDSQSHIRVLKESLGLKDDQYNLLLADVEELRRNLDERNKLIDRRSYQQTFQSGGGPGQLMRGVGNGQQQHFGGVGGGPGKQQQQQQINHLQYQEELHEMQSLLDMRDKRISELQRKLIQLEHVLVEREAQLDRARMRLDHSSSGGGGGGGGGYGAQENTAGLLNHLEETLSDKEKQVALLREQRDRAEHELNEERDSHERSIKEYKMKLNSVKFEMEKLQNRLSKTASGGGGQLDYATGGGGTGYSGASERAQSELVKRLELDKRSLQLECERLRDKLETGVGSVGGGRLTGGSSLGRASSAMGDYSVVEFERLQEALEGQKQELRRAQAECRMNEMERKRAQEEADKLSERHERLASEMHKLKAKFENCSSERDQLLEDYERQQSLASKCQQERDQALADINQLKLDHERLQTNFNKCQLECERLQAQVERAQLECRKLETARVEEQDELRSLQADKSAQMREQAKLELQVKSVEMQAKRSSQERDLARQELERVRSSYERLEQDWERHLQDKELSAQQCTVYKERLEAQATQVQKVLKERDQLTHELEEVRERLHKQQKLQDSSEHETRQEVRMWKEKQERLMLQCEKLNEELLAKQKEHQMLMEKLQRAQSDNVKLEAKLEQCEMDKERMIIEVEKCQTINARAKDDHKKWTDEIGQLQEMYTKTNTKLLNLTEVEERLRIDYEKCQMDLEVLRERYEKMQLENRKLQQERDRLQVEFESRGPGASGTGQAAPTSGSTSGVATHHHQQQQQQQQQQITSELQRVSSELERTLVKLEQYQREINKLQLEKERLILDSKAALQRVEQQNQQHLLKVKSNEEKLLMELERSRIQLDKVQSKCEQTNVDQEKLLADKERLKQQLLLLQQEVDKFRSQQSNSAQETKRLHEEELQRVLQELETVREKYTQQRKELLQLRELQQNHEIDKDILKRELEAAESRLEKLQAQEGRQRQDGERCLIEIEKMKDKFERKQQELTRTQKERDQFAQEIQVLHRQIQQLQVQFEQQQQQQQAGAQAQAAQQGQQAKQQPQMQQQQQQQQQQVKPEEINKLKQMLVKSENDLQKTMAENQRLQMEVERLKLQLDDAAEYIGKIENDNKLIARQNSEILEQLKQQQAAEQQQKAQAGQKQQQESSGNKQQQQQQQQLKELELAQQEMKKMQEVIKKSAQEIQRIHDEKSKILEANKEMQRALEATKSEFGSTLEQYEHELDRLQKEAQQQREQQKQQASATSGQQDQQNSEYKIKFEKAVEAIKAFQKTTEDMKKEIIEMNKRNKSLGEQNAALNETLRSTEEQLKRAQLSVQQIQQQQQGGQKQQDNKDNQQQQQVVAKEVDEMRQQVGKLSEMCAKLERELGKSHEETQQHAQANAQLKQAVERSQSELGNLRSERNQYQQQLEKLIVELERREDEMANLQNQQDKSGANLQAKQNELQTYQRQLDEREKALEAKRQELANLSKQIQQQQQQQPPQQAPAGNQQQQQQKQQAELIAKLQVQIKNLEDERTKLKGELERVRNELKQAQAELERLLKILSASEEEKFNLTQQIDQLQAKLRSIPQQQQQGPPQQQQQQPAQGAGRLQQQQQQQHVRGPPPQRQAAAGPAPPGQPGGPRGPPPPGAQQPAGQRPPNPQQQQQQPRPQNPQQQPRQPPPAQAQSPALNQPADSNNHNTSSASLCGDMEMLEAALKQSIEWSMGNRCETSLGSKDGVDSTDCQHELESHVRACISRFKIELNQLMDARLAASDCCCDDASDPRSAVSCDSELRNSAIHNKTSFKCDTVAPQPTCAPGAESENEPTIMLNGKYSGVYRISGHDEPAVARANVDQVVRRPRRGHSEKRQQVSAQQVDDGYRSLSRDGTLGRSASSASSSLTQRDESFRRRQSNAANALLIQQLNDIKSRAIDLVQELDQIVVCRARGRGEGDSSQPPKLLEDDELEAYRRRRDTLVAKVDQLIEAQRATDDQRGIISTSSSSSSSSSSLSVTSSSCSSSDEDRRRRTGRARARDYEEQIHVIDYDFNRRASDLSEIKKRENRNHVISINNKPDPRLASTDSQPLSTAALATTTINVTSDRAKQTDCVIDFGAMMRDCEERKGQKVAQSTHQASYSSASSLHSSGASSSSFI